METVILSRRSALLSIGAALAAPAIVKAESLMKIVMSKPARLVVGLDLASYSDYTITSFILAGIVMAHNEGLTLIATSPSTYVWSTVKGRTYAGDLVRIDPTTGSYVSLVA